MRLGALELGILDATSSTREIVDKFGAQGNPQCARRIENHQMLWFRYPIVTMLLGATAGIHPGFSGVIDWLFTKNSGIYSV